MLCGVEIDSSPRLEGTSDADVALHAVIDAMLGAAALGDLGDHFPSSDARWEGADSGELAGIAKREVEDAGFSVAAIDVTIICESVRIAPHRGAMRERLGELLGVEISAVSVKATSSDGLGFTGRGEGIASAAVVTLEPSAQP